MTHAFRRNTAQHRHALKPAPGMVAYEVDSSIEVIEGNEDDDWIQWEDSVRPSDSGFLPVDPFERVSRRGG
jgi:hypothetical protein